MKKSIKEIAHLASKHISEDNFEQLGRTVWLELQSNKKFGRLNELIKLIRQVTAENENKKIAEIISSSELTPGEKEMILKKIEERIKNKILPIFIVDKDILGGIKIKIEDDVLDFSWKGKLQLIRAKLEGNHE